MTENLVLCANARWLPRAQSLDDAASRWLQVVARLREADPIFGKWFVFDDHDQIKSLLLDLKSVVNAIAAGVERDENRKPVPNTTHRLHSRTSDADIAGPDVFELDLLIDQDWKFANNFIGLAPPFYIDNQDASCMTFNLYREAVLAMAESFEATHAQAYSRDLMFSWPQGRECPDLPPTWISYLGPRYAHLVTPPETAFVEHRPDGGLLMAATRDVFAMGNPLHMAVAHDIARAVAPFNALPRPLAP